MESFEEKLKTQLKFAMEKRTATYQDQQKVESEKWDGYCQGLTFAINELKIVKNGTASGETLRKGA